MKKMIMALAIAVAAFGVQASSCNWKLTTGNSSLTVYAFANTTASTILAACASSDASDWTSTFASAYVGTNSGSGSRVAAAGEVNGIVANDTITFVVVDGAIAEGTNYTVYDAKTIPAANVFDPPTTGTILAFKMADVTSAGAGTFQSVPEPTSGLLLLLGMAGLALRRRRA